MIEAGALYGVAAIVGGHVGAVSCELESGQAGFLHGPMMASSDRFRGAFIGSGGHGSEPHRTPDPVTALAEFILALNSFRARELDQTRPAVVSVCSIHGGEAFNVIPERTEFKGTARCIHPDIRAILAERIGAIGADIARMHRLELDFQWIHGYPPVVNDPRASTLAADAARDVLGAGRVTLLTRPSMGGEDFAFYLAQVPGCYWFLEHLRPGPGDRPAQPQPPLRCGRRPALGPDGGQPGRGRTAGGGLRLREPLPALPACSGGKGVVGVLIFEGCMILVAGVLLGWICAGACNASL